jgi:hypothetical protein
MALETATHINDLVVTNPLGTDTKAQGDDHLRLIKQVLKTDLPLTTPATATGISLLTAASADAARTVIGVKQLQSVDYSLSGNALTLKLNPTVLDFRSTTLTDGVSSGVANASQITTVISSGSTGGTTSAVQSDIIILAINNAGTMELAWTNSAGGLVLDEQGVITTVAEGGAGAADSATTIYSTTARTGVAYRVVGLFRSTQTTAGTWAQTPTLVQPMGGQALVGLQSASWQVVTGSRALATTYYNTASTQRKVLISVSGANAATAYIAATVNGVLIAYGSEAAAASGISTISFTVPPGQSYSVANANGSFSGMQKWSELN